MLGFNWTQFDPIRFETGTGLTLNSKRTFTVAALVAIGVGFQNCGKMKTNTGTLASISNSGNPMITSSSIPNGPIVSLATNPSLSDPTVATGASIVFTITPGTSAVASTGCSLDSTPPSACTSPTVLTNLLPGTHSYLVSATDTNGLVGTAKIVWTIKQVLVPAITFAPPTGPAGTLITVSSSKFDLSKIQSVTIAGVTPIVISSTSNSAILFVMPGTANGPISIATANGTITSGSNFSVVPSSPLAKLQGTPLQGSGGVKSGQYGPFQGNAVALSADGNTALIGGPLDNGPGAVWVFVRSGNTWTQQGNKLVGSPALDFMGYSLGISADGNTALIGSSGQAYVFVRNGGAWSLQATLSNATQAQQGWFVGLSADGNTAVVAGLSYTMVFVRTGTTWTQTADKLHGLTDSGYYGGAVISADGTTIVVGGGNVVNTGTITAYARTANGFVQQGPTLVPTGGSSLSTAGLAVALSADGNTLVASSLGRFNSGDIFNSPNPPSYWIFTRAGTTWSQQTVLTGGPSQQGYSVALSADGNTLLAGSSGGFSASTTNGVANTQVFNRVGTTWTQVGAGLTLPGVTLSGTPIIISAVALSADGNTALVGNPTAIGPKGEPYYGSASVFVP
jgi:hypothetical protein